MIKRTLFTTILALSTVAGCAAQSGTTDHGAGDTAAERATGELTLETRSDDRVTGRYAENGAVLRFEFARHGDEHRVELTTATGAPLLSSTLAKGIESMRVLDRATTTGAPDDADPKMEGDLSAYADLANAPEMALVDSLKLALANEGVDRGLFSPAEHGGGIEPKANMNQWVTLGCFQGARFPTWAFWRITRLRVENVSPRTATFQFVGFFGTWEDLSLGAWGGYTYTRQFAGFPVQVQNLCNAGSASLAILVY